MPSLRYVLAVALLTAPTVASRADEAKLPWSSDLAKSMEAARKSGKKVFVDFTGDG